MELPPRIAELLARYLGEVVGMAQCFRKALEALERFDLGNAYRSLSRAIEADTRADAIRRVLYEEVLRSVEEPDLRNRLSRYLRMVDRTSEMLKEASRYLELIPYLEIPAEIRRGIRELASLCLEAVRAIHAISLRLAEGALEEVQELAKHVECVEEEADAVNDRVRRMLMVYGPRFSNPAIPVVLRDFVEALEGVTDYAEDVADTAVLLMGVLGGGSGRAVAIIGHLGGGSSRPRRT